MLQESLELDLPISFEGFRITRSITPAPVVPNARVRQERQTTRQAGEFLKGPVPLDWLATAAKLPGKALQTALAIWFEYGRRREAEQFPLTSAVLDRFGVSRKAKYSAIEALERAGLVSVVHRKKRNPLVTVLA